MIFQVSCNKHTPAEKFPAAQALHGCLPLSENDPGSQDLFIVREYVILPPVHMRRTRWGDTE